MSTVDSPTIRITFIILETFHKIYHYFEFSFMFFHKSDEA